mmetsp:Transcript_20853/g.48338  ORF Transcript_20853/g.48338 Transcript_20853/m.48338 type:complete len:205 (+) Transcript_20853:1268-1882(+)
MVANCRDCASQRCPYTDQAIGSLDQSHCIASLGIMPHLRLEASKGAVNNTSHFPLEGGRSGAFCYWRRCPESAVPAIRRVVAIFHSWSRSDIARLWRSTLSCKGGSCGCNLRPVLCLPGRHSRCKPQCNKIRAHWHVITRTELRLDCDNLTGHGSLHCSDCSIRGLLQLNKGCANIYLVANFAQETCEGSISRTHLYMVTTTNA